MCGAKPIFCAHAKEDIQIGGARKGVASVARLAWRASGGKGKGVEEEKESGNEDEKTRSMETESVTFVRSGRSGGTASGIAARPRDLSSRIAARP